MTVASYPPPKRRSSAAGTSSVGGGGGGGGSGGTHNKQLRKLSDTSRGLTVSSSEASWDGSDGWDQDGGGEHHDSYIHRENPQFSSSIGRRRSRQQQQQQQLRQQSFSQTRNQGEKEGDLGTFLTSQRPLRRRSSLTNKNNKNRSTPNPYISRTPSFSSGEQSKKKNEQLHQQYERKDEHGDSAKVDGDGDGSSASGSDDYDDDDDSFFSDVSSLSGTRFSEQSDEFCFYFSSNPHHHHQSQQQYQRKLFGRDKEVQQLRDAFSRVRTTGKPELWIVEGTSGAGKSFLVDTALRHAVARQDGYFGMGKFLQSTHSNSATNSNSSSSNNNALQSTYHSALVAAFTDVCDLVQQQVGDERKATQTRIQEALRPEEISILQSLIPISNILPGSNTITNLQEDMPSLSTFIQTKPSSLLNRNDDGRSVASASTCSSSANSSTTYAFRKFQLMYRKLVRVMATPEHPLVLFLDDLHWADKASLSVIKSLLRDQEMARHCLLVCTYRTENAHANMDLQKFLQYCCTQNTKADNNSTVSRFSSTTAIQTRLITIQDLPAGVVNQMIQYMTRGMSDQDTKPLAQLVWNKTHGNPFFVEQFLHHLWATKRMMYRRRQWHWDVNSIQAETDVCENVLQLVAQKVRNLHPLVQKTLQLASCLGSFFDVPILQSIAMTDFKPKQRKQQKKNGQQQQQLPAQEMVDRKFLQILQVGVKEGLIENSDRPKRYKFTHDRVQQCLYNMIPEEQLWQLHAQIGNTVRTLLKKPNAQGGQQGQQLDKDFLLFLATDQLNVAAKSITNRVHRRELIHLNMTAGRRAMSKSSFLSAASYLRHAIRLLDADTMWRKDGDYELSLELYTTSAVYESCSGNFDECQKQSSEVLLHAGCIEDKMGAYKILMDTLGTQGQLVDATQLGLNVLGELGEKTPNKTPTTMQVTMEVMRATRAARSVTDQDFLSLPLMTDARKLAASSVLVSVSTFAFFLEASNLLTLVTAKMMRLTLQYGSSNMTPICFACWAMLQSQQGNGAEAYRFGRLSLLLLERSMAHDAEAMALGIIYSFANHWQRPLRESILPLQKAYLSGLKYGNIDHGVLSGFNSIGASMATGRSLRVVEAEMREFYSRMLDFGQDMTALSSAPVWQTILNLMGRSDEPLVLTGEAMNEDEAFQDACESQNAMALHFMDFSKLKIACFFQDWTLAEEALERIEEHKEVAKGVRAHFSIVESTYFEGLTSMLLAQSSTNKRKFLKHGRQALKKLDQWHSEGKTDALPYLLSLEAEHACALGAHLDELQESFEHFIAAADACQFVHMEAYAYERLGTLMNEKSHFSNGCRMLREAKKLYNKWGALSKVQQVETKLAELTGKEV